MIVIFYTDGNGHWTKREWLGQCKHEMTFEKKCQGVVGHKGHHWAYKSDGSYEWDSEREDLEQWDISGGWTPPGHKNWISPVDKMSEYYVSFFQDSEVTDPDEIARLERGEHKEDEVIDSPLSPEEIKELGLNDCKEFL